MENNKNKKLIFAAIAALVVIVVAIIIFAVSCNSDKNDDTEKGSEDITYESTEEIASEDMEEETEEESVVMGDNEVPFDDSAAEDMSLSENTNETIVYEVTEADGSKVTEADGSVVTTFAYVTEAVVGDNEVSFGDTTTEAVDNGNTEEATTEAAETHPDSSNEVETDKDGWTTNIVKP